MDKPRPARNKRRRRRGRRGTIGATLSSRKKAAPTKPVCQITMEEKIIPVLAEFVSKHSAISKEKAEKAIFSIMKGDRQFTPDEFRQLSVLFSPQGVDKSKTTTPPSTGLFWSGFNLQSESSSDKELLQHTSDRLSATTDKDMMLTKFDELHEFLKECEFWFNAWTETGDYWKMSSRMFAFNSVLDFPRHVFLLSNKTHATGEGKTFVNSYFVTVELPYIIQLYAEEGERRKESLDLTVVVINTKSNCDPISEVITKSLPQMLANHRYPPTVQVDCYTCPATSKEALAVCAEKHVKWISFVRAYATDYGVPWKEALEKASPLWRARRQLK